MTPLPAERQEDTLLAAAEHMWAFLGASIDLIHALSMAVWVLGLPLLFLRRWPRASRLYAVYSITFIAINQVSMWTLHECFLTTLARACWERTPEAMTAVHSEWFTVRVAYAIFGLTPSHRLVKTISELLILATAAGVLFSTFRLRRLRRSDP